MGALSHHSSSGIHYLGSGHYNQQRLNNSNLNNNWTNNSSFNRAVWQANKNKTNVDSSGVGVIQNDYKDEFKTY